MSHLAASERDRTKIRGEMRKWLGEDYDNVPVRFYLVKDIIVPQGHERRWRVEYDSFNISEVFEAWHTFFRTGDQYIIVCSHW